jgi:neutral ceramidase
MRLATFFGCILCLFLATIVMACIPSRRLWEEGGYQAGAFDVYGLPANRWSPDIEDRIAGTVFRLVEKVR